MGGTRRLATIADDASPRSPITRPKAAPAHQQPATLSIRDGPFFSGNSFGSHRDVSGEVVFTTSIVGYPESLTDPSYRGQILVFTQPLIGKNYGVPSREARDEFNLLKHFESEYIQPIGVVVAGVARKYSHWTAIQSLGEWCTQQGVAAITGVDTRAIVTFLCERGSTLGKISFGEAYDADQDEAFQDPGNVNLV
ncbi:MAG: Multifunctional pyrimidine synthesis protein CAD [Alectoria fallacina]|uniref:Multifunctional pyrimidine synthesis protein CAD n=1 Tax=Alectoria fallacina TaxID=1903189 RepID=A0A8H3G2P6_9LECA|nr:MAG: Multifunctional pyrimidine synthesis protein CAD [Alectoria fallacina]